MQNDPVKQSIGIIGAGITGLSCALALKQAGHPITVWEPSNRSGGAVISQNIKGYLCEEGPNSMLVKSREVMDWIQQLMPPSEICLANPEAKRRYIVRNGKAHPLPGSLWQAVRTPLYRHRAKLNILGEPFRRKCASDDESVASFVRRRMGAEFLDYGIACLVTGIYAGDPERISIRYAFPKVWNLEQEHGSLIRGALKRWRTGAGKTAFKPCMLSFLEGLESLTKKIAENLGDGIQTSVAIDNIESSPTGWVVKGRRMGDSFVSHVNKLVVTIPQHQLAQLPFSQQSETTREIQSLLKKTGILDHPPLTTLVLGFERDQITHPLDGFGMLIPAKEKRFLLGSIFSSTLFPGRAPKGHVSLMNFIGGVMNPDRAELPEAEQVDRSCRDLRELLGVSGTPKFVHRKLWHQAIPQYKVGHGLFIQQLEAIENRHPNIYFQGNYRGGPGLSDCIENALKLVASH